MEVQCIRKKTVFGMTTFIFQHGLNSRRQLLVLQATWRTFTAALWNIYSVLCQDDPSVRWRSELCRGQCRTDSDHCMFLLVLSLLHWKCVWDLCHAEKWSCYWCFPSTRVQTSTNVDELLWQSLHCMLPMAVDIHSCTALSTFSWFTDSDLRQKCQMN